MPGAPRLPRPLLAHPGRRRRHQFLGCALLLCGARAPLAEHTLAHRLCAHLRPAQPLQQARGRGIGPAGARLHTRLAQQPSQLPVTEWRQQAVQGTTAPLTGVTAPAATRQPDPTEGRRYQPRILAIPAAAATRAERTCDRQRFHLLPDDHQQTLHGRASRLQNLPFHGVNVAGWIDLHGQCYACQHERPPSVTAVSAPVTVSSRSCSCPSSPHFWVEPIFTKVLDLTHNLWYLGPYVNWSGLGGTVRVLLVQH